MLDTTEVGKTESLINDWDKIEHRIDYEDDWLLTKDWMTPIDQLCTEDKKSLTKGKPTKII